MPVRALRPPHASGVTSAWAIRPKTINARKGVKTRSAEVGGFRLSVVQKLSMPVRALRPTLFPRASITSAQVQKLSMPVRALRRRELALLPTVQHSVQKLSMPVRALRRSAPAPGAIAGKAVQKLSMPVRALRPGHHRASYFISGVSKNYQCP